MSTNPTEMSAATPRRSLFPAAGAEDSEEALAYITATVKELSGTTDPREMVQIFGDRVGSIVPRDFTITMTRRDLDPPKYRISRCSRWEDPPDPWTEQHKLPVLEGGILGELIYGNEPLVIDDLHVGEDDPAYDLLHDVRSMMVLPNYDRGESLNMMILLSLEPNSFDRALLPEMLWTTNLFGRAIHNLRVGEELRKTYAKIDREVQVVSEIQRSLLPKELPRVPNLEFAAYYQTARQAGGDYYDFFEIPDGRLGILIADVCGHGPAAAVLMAITHSLFHANSLPVESPSKTLDYVNGRLLKDYTHESRSFVTAFYGVFDPERRTLTYSSAGHEPPRVCNADTGTFSVLEEPRNLPLGISAESVHGEACVNLAVGDRIVFYTDGITEAHGPDRVLFGTERLDGVLCQQWATADALLAGVLDAVEEFTGGAAPHDDRTLLVAKLT